MFLAPRQLAFARRASQVLVAVALCLLASARFQDAVDEYDVKAAFLLNFARYVTAPNPSQGEYQIGILKPNPIRPDLLRELQAKQIGARPVKIREFEPDDDWTRCDLLYVPGKDSTAAARLKAVVTRAGSSPLVVVAECDRAAENGALLGFVMQENRVRFEVSKEAATRTKLSIDAKLARLAVRIVD